VLSVAAENAGENVSVPVEALKPVTVALCPESVPEVMVTVQPTNIFDGAVRAEQTNVLVVPEPVAVPVTDPGIRVYTELLSVAVVKAGDSVKVPVEPLYAVTVELCPASVPAVIFIW
jgi:hypothetical protein